MVLAHGDNQAADILRQAAGRIVHVVDMLGTIEPHAEELALRQEALVRGAVEVLAAPEQRELVLVGTALAVRAEHGAVAALVAHPVNVDDLVLGLAHLALPVVNLRDQITKLRDSSLI